VLTGVVDVPQLLAAPRGSRPTYVAADLRGLLAAQPAVVDGGCGTATAAYDNGVLRVTGQGADALRAACAVAWAAADEGRPLVEVDGL
jgi:glycerol 3-phosphatase-2